MNRAATEKGQCHERVASGTYNSRSWTFDTALDLDDYLSFGFSVDPGFTIDLETLDIRYDRSGTGPTQLELYVTTAGFSPFSNSTLVFDDSNVSSLGENHTQTLTGLTGLTGSVEFRLFAFGASTSLGTFDIENASAFGGHGIVLRGTSSPVVPEPASVWLLLIGGRLAMLRRVRAGRD